MEMVLSPVWPFDPCRNMINWWLLTLTTLMKFSHALTTVKKCCVTDTIFSAHVIFVTETKQQFQRHKFKWTKITDTFNRYLNSIHWPMTCTSEKKSNRWKANAAAFWQSTHHANSPRKWHTSQRCLVIWFVDQHETSINIRFTSIWEIFIFLSLFFLNDTC